MDELTEILMGVPETTANLQLPDPKLRDFFRDEQDRIYWLDGEICEDTLDLVKMIMKCNKQDKGLPIEERKPITIMIDSNGGAVDVLWCIIKAIEISKTPVRTCVYCTAYSAAADLLASGHKGMRYAMPGCSIMMHSGSCTYQGTQSQVDAAKKFFDGMGKRIVDYVLEHTDIDSKTAKKMKDDFYMSENDAEQLGIIDTIITDLDILF